ncbi:MAG: PAS domain S-box protein [Spirochaetes bacterium]|nr:PAS domain S-box protein [Spirochaetota bacterium]
MKKILLVEDEILTAILEMEQIRHGGYEVSHVSSGEEAVKAVSENSYDLVLMDINLGSGMDGTEAAQTIFNDYYLPVIFLSSHMEQSIVEKTEKITSYGYIVKNSGQFVLLASIKMAFRLFEANSEISSHKTLLEELNQSLISANEELAQTVEELEQTNMKLSASLNNLGKKENETEWLLNSMYNAFALLESVFSETEEFVSYRFLYINKAYENITGLKLEEVKGRTVHEIWPDIQNDWIEYYGKTAVTGEALEFELFHNPTKKFFHCNVYRPWKTKDRFCAVFEDVTEIKKNTEEVNEIKNRYSKILETVLDGVVMTDKEGNIIYVNEAARKILETDEEDIISGKFSDSAWSNIDINGITLPPDRLPLSITLKEGRSLNAYIYGISREEGNTKFLSVNSSPLFNSDGEITGAVISFRDITEIRKIENQILESRANYQLVVDSIEESLSLIDSSGNFIFCNSNAAKNMNRSNPQSMIGHNIKEFIPLQQAEELIKKYVKVLNENTPLLQDIKLLLIGGERWFHNRLIPVEIGTHNEQAVLSISMDITDRKTTEDELQKINKIFTFSTDLLCISGHDGSFKLLNPSWEKTLGWNLQEIQSGQISDFLHPDDRKIFESALAEIFNGKNFYQIEIRFLCKDETYKWFSWNLIPEKEENIFFGVARDITERKQHDIYYNLSGESLFILNDSKTFQEAIKKIISLIRKKTGCDAAAIRLENEEDYPFFEQQGFDSQFMETENLIRIRNESGKFHCEEGGTRFKCLCGLVLSGKADLSDPNFTQAGSFRTNDASQLKNSPENAALILNPAYTCITEGYASIALIPVRTRNRIAGIIQINDRRKNFFSEHVIQALETLADHVGEALIRKFTEDKLILALQESDMLKAEAEKLNAEKELMLHEVHHRIKNNMNTICNILTLQANFSKNDDTKSTLLEAAGRVHSMMTLYEKLYQSEDIRIISLKIYLTALIYDIINLFPEHGKIKVETSIDEIVLSPNILNPVGIIITELITNSMKYAFNDRDSGIIKITALKNGNKITVIFENNGIPLPDSIGFENSQGFGMQLIRLLMKQIQGTMEIERRNGTRFILKFKLQEIPGKKPPEMKTELN